MNKNKRFKPLALFSINKCYSNRTIIWIAITSIAFVAMKNILQAISGNDIITIPSTQTVNNIMINLLDVFNENAIKTTTDGEGSSKLQQQQQQQQQQQRQQQKVAAYYSEKMETCGNSTPIWPLEKIEWPHYSVPSYFASINSSNDALLQLSIDEYNERSTDERYDNDYKLPKEIKQKAVCRFLHKDIKFGNHFPHAMQQLYACLSWWLINTDIPRILVFDFKYKYPMKRSQIYTHSMIKAFQDVLNVKVVKKTKLPSIRIKELRNFTMHIPPIQFRNGCIEFYNISLRQSSFIYRNLSTKTSFTNRISATDDDVVRSIDDENVQEDDAILKQVQVDKNVINKEDTSTILIQLPKIGILNRQFSESRSILNVDQLQIELYEMIINEYYNYDTTNATAHNIISIEYFDNKTFIQQIQFYMDHDIIISPHGAQLTSIPFMPIDTGCSIIIEIFPHGHYAPYYFGSLASISNMQYYSFYCSLNHSSTVAHYSHYKRTVSKRAKFCLPISYIVQEIHPLIEEWIQCKIKANNQVKK